MWTRSVSRARRLVLLLSATLVAVAAACLLGCPARLPAGATALDAIDVEGVEEVDEDDLLGAIASEPTGKLLGIARAWWMEYSVFDETTLEKDLERIERFYRARGYYDARVRAARVVRTGERSVRVQIVLEEGELVRVEKVQVSGITELPDDVRRRLVSSWKLGPGDAFDEDLYRASGAAAEQLLTDEGFGYATVKLGADVDLVKRTAVISAEVIPGPRCTFGKITITGLNEVAEDVVRRVLMIEEGDRYSTKAMREAQAALFDLGAFDAVDFEPQLGDRAQTVIPVKVALGESKLRRVRLGPGFFVDPLRSDFHLTAGWEHRNFLGGLRRFRADVRPMVVLKPGYFNPQVFRPGFLATADLQQPAFIESRTALVVQTQGGILPDPVNLPTSDYRTTYLLGSIGLERRFLPFIYTGIFYRRALQLPSAYSGSELPPNVFRAQLGFVEWLASLDARDDIVKPTRGFYLSASAQYAFRGAAFFGGDFRDVRLQPEIRMYGPLAKGLVLALRFTTGFLLPWSGGGYDTVQTNYDDSLRARGVDPASAPPAPPPYWRAFFSGGPVGNRGYPIRSVGTRDCAPDQAFATNACDVIVGGASMWESSLELRIDMSGPLGAVLFVDASDVSRDVFDIRLHYPHLSVGPGLRYETPVGPIRLDVGYRVPGLQRIGGSLTPQEQVKDFAFGIRGPFALHVSIGEAF